MSSKVAVRERVFGGYNLFTIAAVTRKPNRSVAKNVAPEGTRTWKMASETCCGHENAASLNSRGPLTKAAAMAAMGARGRAWVLANAARPPLAQKYLEAMLRTVKPQVEPLSEIRAYRQTAL